MKRALTGRRTVPRGYGFVACLLLGGLLFVALASSASAQTRLYTGVSFGPEGKTGSATFGNVQGVAVDQSNGDVYVYDTSGTGKIYKFNSAGESVNFTSTGTNMIGSVGGGPAEPGAEQIAVAPAGAPGGTAGDIYVATNEEGEGVRVFSPAGDLLGKLGEGETCGVAVDPDGHLFIGTYVLGGGVVREYLPTSNPPHNTDKTTTSVAHLYEICNVAIDGAGNVYASNYAGEFTARLKGVADPSPAAIRPGSATLAADPPNNELYLDKGNHISVYDSAGVPLYDFGTGNLTNSFGIAINSSVDEVYAADGGSHTVKVFSSPVEALTNAASDLQLESATLNGTADTGGLPVQGCVFEYGPTTEAGFGSQVPCTPAAADIPQDSSPHAVTGALTGLAPNTSYHFRLTITIGGTVLSGEELEFSTVGPPRITELSSSADQGAATLAATVDPRGVATSYRIEWGPSASYGKVAATGTVTPGEGPTQVAAHLTGLALATTYHWRVIAESTEGGNTASADQLVETMNSCGLPDGRCYELVSLASKGPLAAPGRVFGPAPQITFQAATAGSALAYTVLSGYPDATAGDAALYLARRGVGGWSSEQLTPPNDVEPAGSWNGSSFKVLSANLACGTVASRTSLVPGAPTTVVEWGGTNLYVRAAADAYQLITSLSPTDLSVQNFATEYEVVGMSPDCQRGVFRTSYHYPGIPAANSKSQLYEWDRGTLRNVAIIPGPGGSADPVSTQSIPGALDIEPTSPEIGAKEPTDYWRAVSTDASRTIFTAISLFGGDSGKRAIFLRNADDPAVRAGTAPATDLSQSETATPNNGNSRFWTASTDGSRIFFTARYGLAANASSSGATSCVNAPSRGGNEGSSGEGCDLYEYNAAAPVGERLTDLSPDTADAKGAGVAGVLDASEDGSYVYFAAHGRLGEAGRTEAANLKAGTYNLYLSHDGAIHFVRLLGRAEVLGASVGGKALVGTRSKNATWTSRATPDGTRLVFESSLGVPGSIPMVYLYSAAEGTTVCVSCRRDGRPPFSEGSLTPLIEAPRMNGENMTVLPTVLSGNGRLYFYSFDPLAPGGIEGARNLYQWEHGQVSLIATEPLGVPRVAGGRAPGEAFFGGASRDGGDVYFTTPQRLVGAAQEGWNVYDARVGGGFAEPPVPTSPCDATAEGACNSGGANNAPTSTAPSTSSFTGPANPPPPKQQKKPHKKKHPKHSKKKTKKKHGKKAGGARRANSDRRAGK